MNCEIHLTKLRSEIGKSNHWDGNIINRFGFIKFNDHIEMWDEWHIFFEVARPQKGEHNGNDLSEMKILSAAEVLVLNVEEGIHENIHLYLMQNQNRDLL